MRAGLALSGIRSSVVTAHALVAGLAAFFLLMQGPTASAHNTTGIYPVPSGCVAPSQSTGRSFYVDPSIGRMNNDGSANAPWSTLSAVVRAGFFANGTIKPGDTVYLRSGNHGSIALSGNNAGFITIAADSGATPVISMVRITGSQWIIKGLTIEGLGATLVNVRTDASNNIVVANHILSQQDVSSWTQADWRSNSSTAVSVDGQCTTILDNTIENVRWGVLERADHALIQGNTINNVADDGMQIKASDIIIRGNRLSNFHDIGDGNHADMIQAINLSRGVYRDITIDGNIGINQTDPNLPFPNGDTQGITEFDGEWDNFNIVNNVVVTNHWHGIALYGATNSSLINNTVFGDNRSRIPWIGIFDSKSGAHPVNNIVRNNLAGRYSYPATGYTRDHNVRVVNPAAAVVKFDATNDVFDLHLKADSPAIDAGTALGAPATDISGAARVPPIDAGAYAYKANGAETSRTVPTATTSQAPSENGSCTPPDYSACGYPDASNTGVPAGTALTDRKTTDSCLVISTDNALIAGLHVTGCIDVEANNVTIQNSRVTAGSGIWWAIKYGATKPNVSGLKILHVKVDSIPGQGPAADGGYAYGISAQGTGMLEVGYSNISGFKDGIDAAQGYIHDNWIHDMSKYPGAHTQGIYVWRAPAGASLLIKHNTVTDLLEDSTAAIFMKEGLRIHDVTIEDNWLAGGSFTLYGGGRDARNIQAIGNKFSTEITPIGGRFGPISYWPMTKDNVWSDNVWANGPRVGKRIARAY